MKGDIHQLMRDNERQTLLDVAAYISETIRSPSDPRADVVDAIARLLDLQWPAVLAEREAWRWRVAVKEDRPVDAELWTCELSPHLRYTVTECVSNDGFRFCAYVQRQGASSKLVETNNPFDARSLCYSHFDAMLEAARAI